MLTAGESSGGSSNSSDDTGSIGVDQGPVSKSIHDLMIFIEIIHGYSEILS